MGRVNMPLAVGKGPNPPFARASSLSASPRPPLPGRRRARVFFGSPAACRDSRKAASPPPSESKAGLLYELRALAKLHSSD
uniref:Uncharacterized protein n=1 Tax=Oryza meridionalis TaxID=40149 RepID=A0A0E0CFU8_9ORYZ